MVLHPPGYSSQNHGLVVNDDPSRWSNSQLSELPDLIHNKTPVDDGDSVITDSARSEYNPRQNRQRPHSFSTISEHPSTSSIRPRGDYHRVVIDRSNGQPNKGLAEEKPPAHPTLEVPIPHYRLGMPLFTSTGSPAFLSAQDSTRGNSRASHRLGDSIPASPLPTIYLSDSLLPDRPSHVSSILSGGAIELGPRPARTEMSVFYEATEPIEPSVFECLASDMDDESVVRYTPGTKDISAANPARIVAQISSESFMDYELVSDFFLTFRSYLSSNHLLALLLARLKWAINRWQDDGRIIRIRTFAALRHWILNYFVDDFLADYDLRVTFCETINSMYNDVKARESGGTSDLKILIDLKRCWHGRCAMCWDSPELSSAYYHPDSPIIPGDTANNNQKNGDADGAQPPAVAQTDQSVNVGGNETYLFDFGGDAGQTDAVAGHYRNHSAATAQSIPASTQSDHSFYVTSCTLPPKSPKRLSITVPSAKAPHPVPLLPKKSFHASQVPPKSSPLTSKRPPYYGHTHKRSGSFSDSVRDDPAYPISGDQRGISSSQEFLDPGSLIRGSLYPPAESYMTMMAPPSPPLPLSSATGPALERQSTVDGSSKPGTSSSGVKTIIGSIRKAFNGAKHGAQGSTSSRHTRGGSGPPLRGKTSMLPNNVSFGSDFYRDRKTSAVAKKPTRIDVLCEEVLKHYRQAIAKQEEEARGDFTQPQPQQQTIVTPRLEVPRAGSRAESGLTMGSESIVIMDDTGLDIPMVSGANGEPVVNIDQAPGLLGSNPEDNKPSNSKTTSLRVPSYDRSTRTRPDDEYSMHIFYDDTGSGISRRPSGTFYESGSSNSQQSFAGERGPSYRQRMSPSLRLRKYASFQSGISRISRRRQAKGSEPVPLLVDSTLLHSEDPEKQHEGPILRRRPGGDLRKMRNGKSQLSYLASRSSSSIVDSEATTSRDVVSRPQTSLIPPNPRFSLMQTNSSQDVRRSFEAAISKFSQIPDDSDGGVESTLLKLEGRWRFPSGSGYSYGLSTGRDRNEPGWLQQRRNVPIIAQDASQRRQTSLGDQVMYSQGRGRLLPSRPYSDSVAESEESFSSIPLLERGLSDESMKKPVLSHVTADPETPRARLSNISSTRNDTSSDWVSSHPSLDVVRETESMRRIPRGSTLPVPRTRTGRLSQLSSEVSVVNILDHNDDVRGGRHSIDSASLGRSSFGIPPHPLAQPPSPPMTIQNPRSVTSCITPLNPVLAQARPLTPDPSPSRWNAGPGPDRSIDIQQDVLSRSELGQQHQHQHQRQKSKTANDVDHVPFILACESQLLAQQLTLVEMAALSEIDWRDLVEMRWSSGAPSIRSWVQFLTSGEHRGIDLVVGRFNLMVKWVLSEIVLAQDINERVQTISKFIHTAVHAKRLCNYATMLQIAIALSSTDCSRLEQTWALVSAEDRRLLKDMEGLIQPVRNFHDLRVEMETANLQEGCIPFVGESFPYLFISPKAKFRRTETNHDRPLYPRPHLQRSKASPSHHPRRRAFGQLRASSHDGSHRKESPSFDRRQHQVLVPARAGRD